jgi:hypothetical protein
LSKNDAWSKAKDFIDFDGLGTRAKPKQSTEKPVYIKTSNMQMAQNA